MNANTLFPLATIAIVAVGVVNGAWSATDSEQSYQGIRYACTGISSESRDGPRWGAYPVKLVFAGADGSFLGDVAVKIADASGAEVFGTRCYGPWLLVDLPPGRYRVEALARHTSAQTFSLDVGAGRQYEHTTRFPDIVN